MYKSLYSIMCMAYKLLIRNAIKLAINNPNSEMDEFAMSLLDKLFDYKE